MTGVIGAERSSISFAALADAARFVFELLRAAIGAFGKRGGSGTGRDGRWFRGDARRASCEVRHRVLSPDVVGFFSTTTRPALPAGEYGFWRHHDVRSQPAQR